MTSRFDVFFSSHLVHHMKLAICSSKQTYHCIYIKLSYQKTSLVVVKYGENMLQLQKT